MADTVWDLTGKSESCLRSLNPKGAKFENDDGDQNVDGNEQNQ